MSDIGWMQTTTAPNGEVYVRVRDVVAWLDDNDALESLYDASATLETLLPGTQQETPKGDMRFTQPWCCRRDFELSELTFCVPMIVCLCCGNKRCPKATDHRLACTQSNAPGQFGSAYAAVTPEPPKGRTSE